MTAVLDVVDCPQCGWSAFYEYQTRTLSTTIFCPRCGYQEETRPNKKRKPALSPSALLRVNSVEGTKADSLVYRTHKRPGWGAYLLKRHNGVSEIGAVHRPLTPRTIARFKQALNHPGIDASQCFLTRWNRKRRRVEVVVGKFPRDLP